MIATINEDVPQDLLDIVCQIDYAAMTREQQEQALLELTAYIDRKGLLKLRRTPIATAQRTVPNATPVQAIDIINRYDYRSLKSWQIAAALPFVRKELTQRGLLK